MSWRFVLSLIFALVVALFAIQNAASVDITFIIWHVSISQALVIIISAIFGAIIVLLLSIIKHLQLNSVIRNNKKIISNLEDENASLKSKIKQLESKLEEPTVVDVSEEEKVF
ncbi:MAG: LapA family protein [Clostridiales bacterium]|nr:LapA family protein [Clostridiales bacterium]